MSGDKAQQNGSRPTQNGVDGSDDVEMKDGSQNTKKGAKGGKDKDGDSDMTVIVPPSKTPTAPSKATEADLTNGATEGNEEDEAEEEVDPQQKAIEGKAASTLILFCCLVSDALARDQSQSASTRTRRHSIRRSI